LGDSPAKWKRILAVNRGSRDPVNDRRVCLVLQEGASEDTSSLIAALTRRR
jgi:hypothetical protein